MVRGGTGIGTEQRRGNARAPRVTAIVLAAGSSTRMGQPKPLLRIAGRPLLAQVLATVRKSQAAETVVVLGHEASRVRAEMPLKHVAVVVNPDYEAGMSTSLRSGVHAASRTSNAFLIVLGDQPYVASSTLDRLIASWHPNGPRILIPVFRGRRGNPVLLDRSLANELDTIHGDVGCRALFGNHADEILEVPVEDPAILVDLDTPEQVETLSNGLAAGRPIPELLQALLPTPQEAREMGTGHGTERPRPSRHTDLQALAVDLDGRGEPYVVATVVRVTRPTSGKVGNRAIIRPGQDMRGWVGGSCTESAVRAESVAALRDGRPRLLRLSKEPNLRGHEEGVVEYTMECHSGGAMDIYLEPHVPKPQLLIVGDSPIAAALSSFGRLMEYHVTLVAPKATPDAFPDANDVRTDVNDLPIPGKGETFAVVATMGKYDEAALRALAPSRASYVGLVASRKRAAAVRDQLRKEGISEDALARIRNPAGLDLSAQSSEEIALSIMAEITKLRRQGGAKEIPVLELAASPPTVDTVLDVVCGMMVDPATPLLADHGGKTYYFCSEVCRAQFRESPASFLH
ncbi:MAG TPA: NTP transferase domain-containing protein [Thermoplasmata archaeon]|nr:NTP transferase domain-containing protein [Thermoplasmata archaeon]